ncbi:MAG TPA: hypothetical protein VFH54_01015 [Mycobacteriales bacterium]|nr:hypothetical protein [Mycobacteriales bacterium]
MSTPAVLRRSARLAAVATGALLPILVAAPALALDDGEQPGSGLSTALVILYFVVIPIGAFLVIAFFAVLPSLLRRPRYRPGRPWNHDPLWFNGPDDPNKALTAARPGATAKGGASAEW